MLGAFLPAIGQACKQNLQKTIVRERTLIRDQADMGRIAAISPDCLDFSVISNFRVVTIMPLSR